jgi:tetratricopeptide (TPR) repeat protein
MKPADSSAQAIRENPQAALNRALGFLRSGQLPRALGLSQQIVKTVPGLTDGWLLLCQLQLELKRPERAMDCVQRALGLSADHLRASLLRVECLVAGSRRDEAFAALPAIESRAQENALVLRLVGNVYAGLQSYEDAGRCFRRSLNLDDTDIECWHLYSGVLFAQGLLDAAEQALNEVLRLDPAHCEALLTRANMRKQTPEENHILELRELLDGDRLDQTGNVMLAYALAKELEDVGEYQQAFQQLLSGANRNDQRLNYPVEKDVAFLHGMPACYERTCSQSTGDEPLGSGLVFVLSLPRAGSTLVDRIIASHSQAQSLGETAAFHEALLQHARAASAVTKMTFTDALAQLDYAAVGRTYLQAVSRDQREAAVLIDKTPDNLPYMGLIHRALPGAKIIHVHKSPMDACYSVFKTYFSKGYGYSYSLEKLASYYIAYQKMMEEWRALLPGVFIDTSYEQLVENQRSQTQRLLDYCCLNWEDECMDFHRNSAATATASVVQVRQPMFRSSLKRWRCYESQLQPLADQLLASGVDIDR